MRLDPLPILLYEARSRIGRMVRRTPLQASDWLSERAGCEVLLKLECWQRTGSFKLRGAYNAVAAMTDRERAGGLVTASAGNHGQAVALAARAHGTSVVVFVPVDAPTTKKSRISGYGAELREIDGTYDDAAVAATEHAEETGAHYLHPFTDPLVVAGQGTVGLEFLEDRPDVRTVVVPVGGGGLLAGVGVAMRALVGDRARVWGVQSSATRAMHAAFEHGAVIETPVEPSLCDGLAGEVEPVSYARARVVANGMRLVDESRIAPTIRELFQREGVVAEGAGATGVAAVLEGAIELEGPAVVVVSGGNIDAATAGRILMGAEWHT